MNRNESNAALRKSEPTPIYDGDGSLLAGQAFTTAAGEMYVSLDGATPVPAANDGVGIGLGFYYYPFSQAETNRDVFVFAIFRKKARLNLGLHTTNCTTKIRAKVPGEAGNAFTMTWVQSGAVTGVGTLTLSGNDYTFTFKDAVTTTANYEALITASANLEIDVAGGAATLHTVDAFTSTPLAGGLRDQGCTQMIDQASTAGATASAVWNALAAGSTTYGDIMRSDLAILAGPVADFTGTTLTFICPMTAKVRWTISLGATGRLVCTPGDLT